MKITEKTTKQGLITFLRDSKVADKGIASRVKYALDMVKKDITKVTRADLYELAQEVMNLQSATPAPKEASLKPKLGAKKSGTAAKKSEPEAPTPAPKKSPKTSKKKEEDSPVETVPPISSKGSDSLPSAKIFPEVIEHPDLGNLIACTGEYTTYADIVEALKAEKTLYFACYWTKRQLREYDYAGTFLVKAPKNGFPHDLDILVAVLPCETVERLFAMSSYTEALYRFEGADFATIEDTDPRSGEKFQIRVSTGMEFEIYRPEDEEVYHSDEE